MGKSNVSIINLVAVLIMFITLASCTNQTGQPQMQNVEETIIALEN